MNDTCAYIHTRLDGIVFYVGIGLPKRPYEITGRNPYWHRTTDKHPWITTILHENLSWDEACKIEIALIKKYRAISGSKLCNLTEGGEGAKGFKPSVESREKMSEAGKRKVFSEAHRANLRASHKGKTPEVRAKISAAKQNISLETRARISLSHRTRPPISEETRAKMSAAAKLREAAKRRLRAMPLVTEVALAVERRQEELVRSATAALV